MNAKAESLLALIAQAAVLKAKHALEAQEEQLRKRRKLLEIKVAISASTAELAVFQGTWECSSGSQTPLDGMNSYLQSSGNPSPSSTWDAGPPGNLSMHQGLNCTE